MSLAINLTEAFRDLVQIGIALTSERDLSTLLNRIMAEARRFTCAEAGTLFLRGNDEPPLPGVPNDRPSRRLGGAGMQPPPPARPPQGFQPRPPRPLPANGGSRNIP